MYRSWINWVILARLSIGLSASPQQTCTAGIHVEGIITDQTGAVIPGATVQAAGISVTTDATGRYVLLCVAANAVISAEARGFANATARIPAQSAGQVHLDIPLTVSAVQTDVEVSGDSDNGTGGDTTTLNTKTVQGLADDPDDFLRELQVLECHWRKYSFVFVSHRSACCC
jgi:hypothetical protein